MTTLYLVRHGETYENKNHIFQGVMDSRLTPFGVETGGCLGRIFRRHSFGRCFHQPPEPGAAHHDRCARPSSGHHARRTGKTP
ncbi:histidine phosphatase family protein [Pseudoramibacter alactolyticus]|uniref:histidine phosphatase family protein n=1 Tax=Pseudoramibacter alactolyticus TaxID=113287 RepID=UPI003BFA06B8